MIIELLEYESKDVELSEEALADLAEVAEKRLLIGLSRQPGLYTVKATENVGTIVASEVTVLIRPKVATEHLFAMLGVGPKSIPGAIYGFDLNPDLLTIMAQVFASSVEHATARGVLHGYRNTEERLISPRGRIDVTEQLRHPAMVSPVACRFDEYTADFFPNRVLVAALDRLDHLPALEPQLRVRLHRLTARFEDVAHSSVDVKLIDRWQPTRIDQHYEEAMRLAAVVLRNLSLSQRSGTQRHVSFTVDMNDLFQLFVTNRLRRYLRGRIELLGEPTVPLDEAKRLNMKPDLVFQKYQQPIFVGDVKYKLSSGSGRISDYYQLLAYTTAMKLNEGVLVYAQNPNDQTELGSDDLVQTTLIKNTDKVIHVYRLPLSGTAAELEIALAQLADWVADLASENSSAAAA